MTTKTKPKPAAKPATVDLFVCWGEEVEVCFSRRAAEVYAEIRGGEITISKQTIELIDPR